MALPTAPFDITKSILAGKSIVSITPSGGTLTNFEVPEISDDTAAPKTDQFKMPDAQGILRVARTGVIEQPEQFSFKTGEVKRMPDIFGPGSFSGAIQATVKFYIPDPQKDASGKIAMISDAIPALVYRDGKIEYGGKISTVTIKIESQKIGAVTWTLDGTTP